MRLSSIALLCFSATHWHGGSSFIVSSPAKTSDMVSLHMASTKKKKKKSGGGGVVAGVKGFGGGLGSGSKSSQKDSGVVMERSKDALKFYDYMEKNGAGDNLKRAALAYFSLPGGGSLRGVVAMKDMKKGDVIIRIPYELAINLGKEGEDPTAPGYILLEQYCKTLSGQSTTDINQLPYFNMLPEFRGTDCMGSTDFFSEEALCALQAPLVVEETLKRRNRTLQRFDSSIASNDDFPKWIDGTDITEEHLRWAVWLITSRVLTVEGDAEENRSYRLLIPFLDMCNHNRASPHVLTGRAVPGGELKVVAGAPISAGEQINICYGGGVAGNDRFLQDYGFLDSDVAYGIVAQQLLGKKKIMEGASAGRSIALGDREATLEKLRETTTQQDSSLWETESDPALKSAIEFRLGVKRALSKFIIME